MKTYETTTQIVNFINVGTYWGPFEYDKLWLPYEEEEHREGNFVCDDYDFEKFKKAILKEVNAIFEAERPLKNYGVSLIKATEMRSPKEYNFGDDWLDLEIAVEDDFLERAEKAIFDPKYRDMLEKFIRAEWCSHDGFISQMPADCLDDMHEVLDMIRNDECGIDDMRAFGGLLQLLREIEKSEGRMAVEDGETDDCIGPECLTQQLYVAIDENYRLKDFCTIISKEEAEKLYPSLFFDVIDDAKKQLDEEMEKYRSSGVDEEAIKKTEAEVKKRHKKLDSYRQEMYEAVEIWHPGNSEKARESLKKLKDKYVEEFGDSPTRAKLGTPDIPGQMKMELT